MKKLLFSLFVLFSVLQWTCSNFPFGSGGDDSRDWVAMTAVINDFQQIVLVDFNNPSKYKLITDDENRNLAAKFSHDRKQLVYEAKRLGTDHDNGLQLVDVSTGAIKRILHDKDPRFNVAGNDVVWHPLNSAIYFRNSDRFGAFTEDVMFFDFESLTVGRLTDTADYSEVPVGFKGADTLIVFSNDTATTHQPLGLYFMDLSGHYLSRIENPHLELINHNGVDVKAPFNPEWNDDLQLFVFAQVDSSLFPGFAIAVTNLDGSFYQTYTDGAVFDDHPTWRPDGKTILFDRHKLSSYGTEYKVMIVDLETGSVKEFVKPKNIRGATSLRFPD